MGKIKNACTVVRALFVGKEGKAISVAHLLSTPHHPDLSGIGLPHAHLCDIQEDAIFIMQGVFACMGGFHFFSVD